MAVYLPKLSPARGNGLGGFPGTAAVSQPLLTFSRIVITSAAGGKIDVPSGAKFMRVTVVGGGGDGGQAAYNGNYWTAGYTYGGGGGGCAATRVITAQPIEYSVSGFYADHGAYASFTGAGDFRDGHTVTASFGSYLLTATGGQHGEAYRATGSAGGVGTGGDYNYVGGIGGSSNHGGGAAGSRGNGGGLLNAGEAGYYSSSDIGGQPGGGSGQSYGGLGDSKNGGGGIGIWTGQGSGTGSWQWNGFSAGVNWMWGTAAGINGGELGGGGGPRLGSGFGWAGVGGNGGIVVEWF